MRARVEGVREARRGAAQARDRERHHTSSDATAAYIQRFSFVTIANSHENLARSLADPTIADAICDRVIHNAHVILLRGGSMRKKKGLGTERT